MAVNGASLLAAAIRSACLAKAPRRTVQAVASAVTGVLVRQEAVGAVPGLSARVPAESQRTAVFKEEETSPEELLQTLRAVRSARRKRKKEKRKAAKSERSRDRGESTAKRSDDADEEMKATEKEEQGHTAAAAAATADESQSSKDHAMGTAKPAPQEETATKNGDEVSAEATDQPPLKQVRINENREMDGIQSDRATSRSSQHSMSTADAQTIVLQQIGAYRNTPGWEEVPEISPSRLARARGKVEEYQQRPASAFTAAALERRRLEKPERRRSRSKAKKKEK